MCLGMCLLILAVSYIRDSIHIYYPLMIPDNPRFILGAIVFLERIHVPMGLLYWISFLWCSFLCLLEGVYTI